MAVLDYNQQAAAQYDPQYNAKRTALINSLAQNTQTLNNQVGGINQNYDNAVTMQNLMNKKSKNNLANTYVGRQFNHGTSQMSALGEADQINQRQIGTINDKRTSDLNNIEAQKALLQQNTDNTLATMAGDRESQIATIAKQLEDRQRAYELQQQQLAIQQAAQQASATNAQRQYELQLAAQKSDSDYKKAMLNLEQWKAGYTDTNGTNKSEPQFVTDKKIAMATIANDPTIDPNEKLAQLNSFAKTYAGVNKPGYDILAQYAKDLATTQQWQISPPSGSSMYNPDYQANEKARNLYGVSPSELAYKQKLQQSQNQQAYDNYKANQGVLEWLLNKISI